MPHYCSYTLRLAGRSREEDLHAPTLFGLNILTIEAVVQKCGRMRRKCCHFAGASTIKSLRLYWWDDEARVHYNIALYSTQLRTTVD